MKVYVKGSKISIYSRIFRTLLNNINHSIARKNISNYPQLAIFSFDHLGLCINLEGRYENQLLLLIKKFIHEKLPHAKDRVFLDIGANIGNHSVFFSNMFKKVYSFEPNPLTYELLRINANIVSNKNITPFNFGLSDTDDSHPFVTNSLNMGSSSIVSKDSNLSITQNISVKKLDNVEEIEKEPLGFIKIDCEGHEFEVLKGSIKTIKKNNMPPILFEQHQSKMSHGSSKSINFLKELGYEFYFIKKNFYFGENVIAKLLSLILRTVFGERYDIVKVNIFEKYFSYMILAIKKPNN